MEETVTSWDKNLDAKTKWSSDLDYISRFNWFIGTAQMSVASSWRLVRENPNALLDSVFYMDAALNDTYVIVALDTFNPVKNELREMLKELIEQLPIAITLLQSGNATMLFDLTMRVDNLFLKIRDVGHKAGLDIKQQMNINRTASSLEKLIGEPRL